MPFSRTSSLFSSRPAAPPPEPPPIRPREPPVAANITYSRGFPSFGNPNHFPNPPTHYFPSITAAHRAKMQRPPPEGEGASPAARSSPSVPAPAGPVPSRRDDLPPQNLVPTSSLRRRREPEWNPAAELLQSENDAESDTDMDDRDAKDDAGSISGMDEAPAKKRSRTLTTAHQTAVLNTLLAKTRFPSTETREEVGLQIGMSARRVQIWFQNRRQSQKRARDRESADGNASCSAVPHSSGHPPPSYHHHPDYLSSDPYPASAYGSHRLPQHSLSIADLTSSRPAPDSGPVSRRTSVDSLASISSFSSAQTSQSAPRAGDSSPRSLGPLSYAGQPPTRHQWPAGSVFPPPPAAGAQRGGYALPPVPSRSEYGNRDQYQPRNPPGAYSGGGDMKLPPLASVVGGAFPRLQSTSAPPPPPIQPPERVTSPQIFNFQPPPLTSTRSFASDRTAQPPSLSSRSSPSSSSTTLARFDTSDFSRLRITAPGSAHQISPAPIPVSSYRESDRANSGSPPDVLDDAMEAMYKTRVNPPRSSLPPLRGRNSFPALQPIRSLDHDLPPRPPSEADAALLAPIKSHPSSALAAKQTFRLPPISSLSLTPSAASNVSSNSSTATMHVSPGLPQVDPGQRASVSPVSSSASSGGPPLSYAHRSSIFSQSSASRWAQEQQARSHPTPARSSISSFDTIGSLLAPSVTSSRTSFSSEVQEEWERASAALGGSGMRLGAGGRKVSLVRNGSDGMEGVSEDRV